MSEMRETNTLIVNDASLQMGFTQIPNWVLRTPKVSRDAKLLFGILLSYAWQKGSCYPGYETLMADMQCARETLAKCIKELQTSGLLSVKRRGQGKTSLYTLNLTSAEADPLKFGSRTSRSSAAEPQGVRLPKHEEDSEEEDSEEDKSNRRVSSSCDSPEPEDEGPSESNEDADDEEERAYIAQYVSDFGREFRDSAPTKVSAARAYNLYRQSGKSLEEFREAMLEARRVTKQQTGNVRKKTADGQKKSLTAYWFSVLESLVIN